MMYGLRLGLTVVVLSVLFAKVDVGEMGRAFGGVKWSFLAGALVLVIPNLGLQCVKWRYLVRLVKPEVRIGEIARSVLAGFGLGLITPGRIGEAGKIFYIRDVRRRALAGLAVAERAYVMVSNVGLGGLAFALLVGKHLWIVFAPLAIALFSLALAPEAGVRVLRRLFGRLPFEEKLRPVLDGLGELNGDHGKSMLSLSVLFYGIHCAQFYLLISAFGHIEVTAALGAIPAIVFVRSMLPVALGDLGIREAASVLVLGKFGIPDAVAVNAALLLFGMNVFVPGVFGALLVHRVRR
ncbi:MAG: flippase-like domain-containing protein [Candidatus Latescibacteria bacterium]|nr:flippase-like domain-containing protein [Candidatus Latescibacterota bacterium]